ncbi:MAG: ATP-binding cassette domain-containing protein, partial [Erysipelotrichaceae bacterium]|nr:ATP-binding cassette domain-containing protein [Erysipelotrichaceae bacterium]
GTNATTIKSHNQQRLYNAKSNVWSGNLTTLQLGEMYKIFLKKDMPVYVRGKLCNASETPVTLHPRWNWLGVLPTFIMSLDEGYDTVIGERGIRLSGGQKQRLCIARALLKKPKILILDDSTSAVDTRTDALIRKSFREYIPTTTKLIISQRISSIEDADRIVIMDDGQINGIGTHEELLKTNEMYKSIYDTQKKGDDENE